MLWARVVRGMSSTARDEIPRLAMAWIVSSEPMGRRKPIKVWPWRRSGISS